MERSPWTFRTLPPELAKTDSWRPVDEDALSPAARDRLRRYRMAIESYIATGKTKSLLAQLQISRSELIRQLNRCVTTSPDGKIFGWTALIPRSRVQGYGRTAALPVERQSNAGSFTGAFSVILQEHPEIANTLNSLILKEKGQVHESKIPVKRLHHAFLRMCDEAGISSRQYPFNTKSRGRRSIQRYVRALLDENLEKGCLARFGRIARSHMYVGRGVASNPLGFGLYDLVGIDPHKLHCYGTVRIVGPKGPQRVAIERIWIVPVLEDFSKAILGYGVGIRTECSSATIEEALIHSLEPWHPRHLKATTVSYKSGAGFPSGVLPEFSGRAWVTMMFDNAATHYSNAIAERARARLGCFINYGPVGHWEHRASLERLMKTLETYGFQRLPSTTGSSPTDASKDNPVRAAIEIGIDWEELLDLIDVILADYNVEPNESLGNRSPLSVLRESASSGQSDFLPRRLPPATAWQPELGIKVETRIIRGNREQGRRPYVEIDRVRYTSPVLSRAFALINRKIRLHIRESNIATVRAYHENGAEIGILTAQGPWGRVPHSREMRKQINALRDIGQLSIGRDEDPIRALMRFYASRAYEETKHRPLKVSHNATKLASAAAISGNPIPEVASPKSGSTDRASGTTQAELPVARPRGLSILVPKPQWRTIIR